MQTKIKKIMAQHNVDAWLMYDNSGTNPLFLQIFGKLFLTRRCFVVFDVAKRPCVICHVIDMACFKMCRNQNEFDYINYTTWQEMFEILKNKLKMYNIVALDICDNGVLPKVAYADYGTVCLVKQYAKNVVSSANLFQELNATFDGQSLELHKKACVLVNQIKDEAFALISKQVKENGFSDEYTIQQFIMQRFKEENLVTDSEPIVAIANNSKNPHYAPTQDNFCKISKGDLVLIDLWAKLDVPNSVFADITWIGYVGQCVPQEIRNIFDIVKTAIDKTLDFLACELPKRKVCGYEVDDVCREVINRSGFGKYFIHRTGHSISIGESDHGVGVNMDNFETHDERNLINNICFSIEPGIYTESLGVREEINVYIQDNKPIVTTLRQDKIVLL